MAGEITGPEKPANPKRLLTVGEVAEMLSMSEQWVRSHANGNRRPHLPCIKMGKTLRFRPADVETFIHRCSSDVAA